MPVPDYATRQAGIMTGEYDYIQQVKPDQYERHQARRAGVEPVVVKPYGWATHRPEHEAGRDDRQASCARRCRPRSTSSR